MGKLATAYQHKTEEKKLQWVIYRRFPTKPIYRNVVGINGQGFVEVNVDVITLCIFIGNFRRKCKLGMSSESFVGVLSETNMDLIIVGIVSVISDD